MGQSKRPKIKVKNSGIEKFLYAVSSGGVILIWVNLFTTWDKIPQRIPVHFGALGKPDSWGSKSSLLGEPIVSTVLYLLFVLLCQIPHCFNYTVDITEENAERQYRNAKDMMLWMITWIVYFFMYIDWRCVQVALDNSKGLGIFALPIFLLFLLGTTIFYIKRMIKLK